MCICNTRTVMQVCLLQISDPAGKICGIKAEFAISAKNTTMSTFLPVFLQWHAVCKAQEPLARTLYEPWPVRKPCGSGVAGHTCTAPRETGEEQLWHPSGLVEAGLLYPNPAHPTLRLSASSTWTTSVFSTGSRLAPRPGPHLPTLLLGTQTRQASRFSRRPHDHATSLWLPPPGQQLVRTSRSSKD